MSTSVIEPGARLAGRYRLETRVSETSGSTLWKAIDETLARAVSVRTFAPGFPRVHEVVTAARAASRLTDPRLAQVFDAEDNTERAYVVSEWISGETLEDLLASGPMDPGRAVPLIMDAAEALSAAHGTGLAHLGLTPRNLLWTTGSTVKVTGLGVVAALSGLGTDDPAAADTRGLGRLLYAALTGHWPGPEETTLPPAPLCGELPCAPRQVRANLPPQLEEIACRALPPATLAPSEAFVTPAELVAALRQLPRTPPPFVSMPQGGATQTRTTPVPSTQHMATTAAAAAPPPPVRQAPRDDLPGTAGWQPARHRRDGGPPNRALVGVAAALVLLVAIVGGWALLRDGDGAPASPPPSSKPARPAADKLDVAGASGFDPGGDDDEHNEEANKAVDGRPGTVWTTELYESARLGKLKPGVGLLLDMGDTVEVSTVKVTAPASPGARMELRVGDSRAFGGLRKVTAAQEIGTGNIELRPGQPASGRYVLLWFTELAPGGGKYRGVVGDVVVSGTK